MLILLRIAFRKQKWRLATFSCLTRVGILPIFALYLNTMYYGNHYQRKQPNGFAQVGAKVAQ